MTPDTTRTEHPLTEASRDLIREHGHKFNSVSHLTKHLVAIEQEVLDHLCRNRRCINPAHLEVVTQRENTLRGVGPTAKNAQKTHCKRGHPLTPENTYLFRSGWRKCRKCQRILDNAYKQRVRHPELLATTPSAEVRQHDPYCPKPGSLAYPLPCTCGFATTPSAEAGE